MKNERIKQRRKSLKLTQEQIAKQVGVSKATISQWEKGDTSPNGENTLRLAKALQTSADWILYGDQPRRIDAAPEYDDDKGASFDWFGGFDLWDDATPLRDDETEVPLFMEVELSAGNGSAQRVEINGPKLRFSKRTLAKRRIPPESAACVVIAGDSMEPVMPDKSVAGVDTSINRINKDGDIYAVDHGGLLRVKKLYRMPGNKIRLSSFNQVEYPDEIADTSEVRILGRVFWWSVLV